MSSGWNTIESDAGVFTYLLDTLGVKGVQFEELLSLDAQELAQLNPVYGVIFLFKYPTDEPYVVKDAPPRDGTFDYDAASEIFFAQQTIQNACGTQALLSIVMNKAGDETGESDSQRIELGEHLENYRQFAIALPPDVRGEALSNDERIRGAHNSFAKSSPFADETQRAANPDDAEAAYHFIAYTATNGRLYELDGLQPAPIDHGPCDAADALDFANKTMDVVGRRIARYDEGEIHFNLLAAVRDRRITARELGDDDLLASENRKRREWLFENELRRHNFVSFTHHLLKGTIMACIASGNNMQEGRQVFDTWVDDARKRIQKRHERQRQPNSDDEMKG